MTKRFVVILSAAFLIIWAATATAAETGKMNWAGFYVGIQGMYGGGDTKWTYEGNESAPYKPNHGISGGMGGVFVGYNLHHRDFVFGLETEINFGDISGSTHCPNTMWGCKSDISWLGASRLRAGYVFDKFMPYVSFGIAYSGIRAYTEGFGADYGRRSAVIGWTPGVGLEYALTRNFILRAEYSYYDFGSHSTNVDYQLGVRNHVRVHAAKAGISYKF
jgi:outer membrane immunogenic protein